MKKPGLFFSLYKLLSPIAATLIELFAGRNKKLSLATIGRKTQNIADYAQELEGCIWFHAASVGEYEQARPVIRELKKTISNKIVVTHFSSSGYQFAQDNIAGDKHFYLPLDTPKNMKNMVSLLKPSLLVFAKYDCWPNLVYEAEKAGVPVLMISGTLPANAHRLNRFTLPFMRETYNRLTEIGVCSTKDKNQFRKTMGVSTKITVSGDTRAEQVLARFNESKNSELVNKLSSFGERRVVFGSIWQQDDDSFFPALPVTLSNNRELKVILVPHEPTPERIHELITRADTILRIPTVLLSELKTDGNGYRAIIVDSVGLLAEIYHCADIAFVGGGFTTGVHSVLEPAAKGVPILFGPNHHNAEEATELIENGGGFEVNNSTDVFHIFKSYLSDEKLLAKSGQAARDVLNTRTGSVKSSVDMIKSYLS